MTVKCSAQCLTCGQLLLLQTDCLTQPVRLVSKHCITGTLFTNHSSTTYSVWTCSDHTARVSSSDLPHSAKSWSRQSLKELSKAIQAERWSQPAGSHTLNHGTLQSLYISNGQAQLCDLNRLKLKAGFGFVDCGLRRSGPGLGQTVSESSKESASLSDQGLFVCLVNLRLKRREKGSGRTINWELLLWKANPGTLIIRIKRQFADHRKNTYWWNKNDVSSL